MVEIMILGKINDLGKDDLIAFSGFILRIYFDAILKYTAETLLKYIEKRNKNAELFIKYYNGNVVIDDEGNKIVQHAILDSNNQKWNYSSILSILIQWKEARNRAKSQEDKLREILERRKAAELSLSKTEPAKQYADKIIDALKEQINANRNKFKQFKEESVTSGKIQQTHRDILLNMKSDDNKLVEQLRKAYEEHDTDLRRYDNALKEVKNWQRQAASHAQQLKETYAQNKIIKANYTRILNALTSVFAKR